MRALRLSCLFACKKATAAAEMALVAPMLIILMFGSFELGNYFLSEHVVVKAVRDGARYASRRAFTNYTCPAATVDSTMVGNVQELTRTGQLTGGTARLPGWTDNNSITVAITCEATGTTYSGIYNGMTDVPVVTISASVPYNSLFNNLGFTSTGLLLNAESESAVMGI